MSLVFVTGGSGFVGGRLISRLVSEGRTVRTLARNDSAARRVTALGASPVHGDLTDPASLSAAASGCELGFTPLRALPAVAAGRSSGRTTSTAPRTCCGPHGRLEYGGSCTSAPKLPCWPERH